MKSLNPIEDYLLPTAYRKYSYYLLVGGIPLIIILFTLSLLLFRQANVPALWDEFGGFALHLPISIGLFWMLFAREQYEDEMFLQLRLKATFHGIRFIFIGVLALPIIIWIKSYGEENLLTMPDIGGNLAVVSLMLVYANGTYWMLKRNLQKDEE